MKAEGVNGMNLSVIPRFRRAGVFLVIVIVIHVSHLPVENAYLGPSGFTRIARDLARIVSKERFLDSTILNSHVCVAEGRPLKNISSGGRIRLT
jgi:Ran GTPase-activating protein (RanGAP) involved in mRNA processing and transport